MDVSIESIIFMDDDARVFTEGVDEYWQKHQQGIPIEPVGYLFEKDGKYYAGEGRHRTYMYYHRLNQRTMHIAKSEIQLNSMHQFHLQNGCVTIADLYEESLYLEIEE
ncbi:MAG: hypothetical protein HGA85_06190 [Nanoarchaeota archaeon]|nr:hypothetical protein [Nanoarchaeota archaeon]